MNILRLSAIFLISMVLLPDSATAHCKGSKHTGDHPHCAGEPPPPPPPPLPPECDDPSPSFAYVREGGRKSPDMTYLSSGDGCIHTPLPGVVGSTVHMTDVQTDGSVSGVFIWSENSGNVKIYQMHRADFTVDSAGELTELTIDPQPLSLEDGPIPDGDYLSYLFPDVWGNNDHTKLYLVFNRGQGDGSGNVHSLWIYNLNDPDLKDKRELYLSAQAASLWNCPAGSTNPEAIAGCHRPETATWDPTGTVLYLQDTLHSPDLMPTSTSVRWNSALRLQLIHSELLKDWTVSLPEIVYTGSGTETVAEPAGSIARPRPAESSGDLILVHGVDSYRGMLDVERCVSLFNATSAPATDLWVDCLLLDEFDTGNAAFGSWQSPNFVLYQARNKQNGKNYNVPSIFRTDIRNGETTKLIDNAEGVDTGN